MAKLSGWLLAAQWGVSTWSSSIWLDSETSSLSLTVLIPQRRGLDSREKNGTFQSNLVLTERTRLHTYPGDRTGSGHVPTRAVQPPLRPASCFRQPISTLVSDGRLQTWSHIQSQEAFLDWVQTRQRVLFSTGLFSYPLPASSSQWIFLDCQSMWSTTDQRTSGLGELTESSSP